MNTGKIMNIIGRILFVEVLLMLPSLFVSLIYRDGDTKAFVYTMIPAAIVSVLLMLVRQQQKRMSSRDGYFIVAMAWIIHFHSRRISFISGRGLCFLLGGIV